jgi:hypothetical protein
MSTWIPSKQFGSFAAKDGKFNANKRMKPKDASQAIRWKKSRKPKVISRKAAARLARP